MFNNSILWNVIVVNIISSFIKSSVISLPLSCLHTYFSVMWNCFMPPLVVDRRANRSCLKRIDYVVVLTGCLHDSLYHLSYVILNSSISL